MSYLSERTQPYVLANTTSATSYAETTATVDMQAVQADSLLIVATVGNTTGGGFTMTAIGGASTSALGGLCVSAGSTSSLLTVATTSMLKASFIDIKNVSHRYVGVKHTGTGATQVAILAFPYDSSQEPMPLTATGSLASTVSGTGFYRSVSPTTA